MIVQQRVVHVFTNEAMLRQAVVDIARYACNGDVGRALGDPIFDAVTVNRGHSRSDSASGDLPHFILKLLGVCDRRLVKYDMSDDEAIPWAMGHNVRRIVFPKSGMFVWAKPKLRPKPGDILYLGSPEHVCVLEEFNEVAEFVASFDYGRRDTRRHRPAGYWEIRPFAVRGTAMFLGNMRLRGWLDVTRIPGLVAEASTVSVSTHRSESAPLGSRRPPSVEPESSQAAPEIGST